MTKISSFPAITTVLDTDEFVLGRSGATKKVTAANLRGTPFTQGILPYIPMIEWTTNSSFQSAGDVIYNIFYVMQPTTITHVIAKHQSATGNIDAGIYNDSGGSGPATKLASSGSVAAGDFIALSSPVNVQPGKYWVALSGSDGGRRVYYNTTMVPPNSTTKIWYGEASGFPLPATASAGVNTHTVMYTVFAGSF